jgi:hypothetical protein
MNIQWVSHVTTWIFHNGTFVTALIALLAVFMAYWQARQIAKTLRAETYLKLADEWRRDSLHHQVNVVLDLWETWKADASKEGKGSDATEWSKFIEQRAKDWVDAHGNESLKWEDRRAVSQFLSKLGPMITNGYLKCNDVFGVVPEMGRLLAVLVPIEIAIQEKHRKSSPSVADWDSPFPKWEFQELWPKYFEWFSRAGKTCLKLQRINWADPRLGVKLPGE